MKKKILIFCDFYLPGFKSGGGMWTVVNLVDRFSSKYDFSIVTRNFDSVGDTKPFTTVKTDEWNDLGNVKVYYTSREKLTVANAAALTIEANPDLIYLNSFFGKPQRNFLYARKKSSFRDIPVVLAPCGEFPEASLSRKRISIKPWKKWIYINYAKSMGLYRDVIWKASSAAEKTEIEAVMGEVCQVYVAPDLVPKTILPDFSIDEKPLKEKGTVKLIFLSRIVPKKNLEFLLRILANLKHGEVLLDIVGPHEDSFYWSECLKLISALPENIKVNIAGPASYADGLKRLTDSHFFILPTLNENFGYVFIEALAAACPLIISDRTLWNSVENANAGWAIALEQPDSWIGRINECLEMDDAAFRRMALHAKSFAHQWLRESKLEEATARVLDEALNGKACGHDNE